MILHCEIELHYTYHIISYHYITISLYHYITATVSLTILITYLEYFGFVTRVNQKRAHDLVTRDIKKTDNSADCR
jgi:hypothetical protein